MLLFKNRLEQMNQITYVIITCDLPSMMQWIFWLGQDQNLISESPDNSFENSVSLGTQFMMQSFKTKCQIRCNPVPRSQQIIMSATYVEIRLSVNLGIMLH